MQPPTELTPVRLPWHSTGQNHCFGCARDNPAGLRLELMESGESLVCDFTLTRLHESFPGIVHGGVAAAVLDEMMGNVLVHRERKVCFTTGLRMTYVGALRVGQPYRAVAWVQDRPAEPTQLFKVQGVIKDADGATLVIARGSFQWISSEAYLRNLTADIPLAPELGPLLRHDG